MRVFYVFLLIIFLPISIQAQNVDLEWVNSNGGVNSDAGISITTSNSKEIYITGIFEGTVDFDPSGSTFNLVSNGGRDLFVQKLDDNGSLVWAKSIGGVNDDSGLSITTDFLGNVFITGTFEGIVDFDPSSSTYNLSSNGNTDVFVLKLDFNGDFVWANSTGGKSIDYCAAIATDKTGNIFTTGYFYDTVDFDPGGSTFNLISNGLADYYIQKIDGNGNFIWAKSIGGSGGDNTFSISINSAEELYITGAYFDTVDFNPDAPVVNLISNGLFDGFVQKLDNNGNFIWAKSFGGISADVGLSITNDNLGDVYVTGNYREKADFDPGNDTFYLTSKGNEDIFILKLDNNGNIVWAKSMGGPSIDVGLNITADIFGGIYLTGYFFEIVDFNPDSDTFLLTSNGLTDAFIQKSNGSGIFEWAISTGGVQVDIGYSLAIDSFGNIYSLGNFQDTVDFDPSSTINNLISNGLSDFYIQKLSQPAVGMKDLNFIQNISIFPNPTSEIIVINLGSLTDVSIKVLNINGQLIHQNENIKSSTYSFNIKGVSGIYILEISSQGVKQQYKIVKH